MFRILLRDHFEYFSFTWVVFPHFTACPKKYIKGMGVMLQYLITAGALFSGTYESLVWHNEHIHIIRIYYLSFMAFTFIISGQVAEMTNVRNQGGYVV